MYSTCLFCNKSLGLNEVVEEFPVGRRLAFDAAKGRLWVVCRKCERWNLTPLEERWEAIEACQRLFAETRTRVSTDNIGLARLREGLDLVRIGQPLRPEFAAWRYGDQFGRRRRRTIAYGASAAVVGLGLTAGSLAVGAAPVFLNLWQLWWDSRSSAKLSLGHGKIVKLKAHHLGATKVIPSSAPEGWSVIVGRQSLATGVLKERHVFRGDEATRIVGMIMPRINHDGGSRAVVRDSVAAIESAGGPEQYLHALAQEPTERKAWTGLPSRWSGPDFQPGDRAIQLGGLSRSAKLALEMAIHEDQERRALEGELKALELAWKNAEEIASIADDLLVPHSVRVFIERQRLRDR